jgi:DNA-binding NtrC family response regulator
MIPPAVFALLESYAWPGNIRELKNMMERAVLLCSGPVLDSEHLPLDKLQPSAAGTPGQPSDAKEISTVGAARTERERIVEALAACAGNQSRAARLLGIPRRTFVSKLDAYQIPRPKKT